MVTTTLVHEEQERRQHQEMVLADWAQAAQRSVLRQMIAVVSRPGILSLAGGLPAPELFPQQEYAEALSSVLRHDGRALQYGPPYEPLKEHIVVLMKQRGVTCKTDQIFITTGAQQALDVLARVLLNPGGQLILEEIVYTGIQQAVASCRPQILSVSTDLDQGMDADQVETILSGGARPAFLYSITDAHNPLGVSISAGRRRQLAHLAASYGLPIVEDDPYGFLTYEEAPLPPMRALEPDWVCYVGSFSKILAPALRLGWIVAPAALCKRLTVVKEAGDLETSALTQRAVSAFLDAGHLPQHLERLRTAYGQRREAMLQALESYFPAQARWTRPTGGMFIWVELPAHIDTVTLLNMAIAEEQVAFIPGQAFAHSGCVATHCMRLNFSNATVEQIEDGVERLGRVVERFV